MKNSNRWVTVFLILLPLLMGLAGVIVPRSSAAAAAEKTLSLARLRGDTAAEADALTMLLEFYPWQEDLWEVLGGVQQKRGENGAAIYAYEQARSAGILSSQGVLLLGEAYAAEDNFQQAITVWRSLLSTADLTVGEYARLASNLRAQEDENGAQLAELRWLERDPDDLEARWRVAAAWSVNQPLEAQALLAAGKWQGSEYQKKVEGLAAALALAQAQPDSAYQRVVIGSSLGNAGEWPLARTVLEQAVLERPDYGEAWGYLAQARLMTGGDALSALEQAQKYAPEADIVRGVAILYWLAADSPLRALPFIQELVKAHPRESVWWMQLGAIQSQLGDLDAAYEAYRTAVNVDTKNAVCWLALANFSAVNQYEVDRIGLSAAAQGLRLAPDDPAALDTMGLIYLARTDLDHAEEYFRRALEKDETFVTAHLHLGQVGLQRQDGNLAYRSLSRAVELDPQGGAGKIASRLLKQYFPQSGGTP